MDESEDCGHLYGYGDPATKRTRLQEIVDQRIKDVAEAKASRSAAELRELADAFFKENGQPQSFFECLNAGESSPWDLALAAEFKRASPSKGDINVDLDCAAQALEYSKVGASVLSVLTEPKWFKGSLHDLCEARLSTQRWAKDCGRSRPVCLRKDFLVDEYQVLEAIAHGADTALLMVSILPQTKLRALLACCREHGMEPLVEVVNTQELKVALAAGACIIGVNNRNLHTFELDKGRTAQLAKELSDLGVAYGPGARIKLLALSGLATADDIEECRKIACSGVLIGEALMRASDPGNAIRAMMMPQAQGQVLPVATGEVIVKVCGVVRPEDARCAVAAGANLVGVIFAKSKRQASTEQALAVRDVVWRFGERSEQVQTATKEANVLSNPVPRLIHRCSLIRAASKRTPLVTGIFMDQPLDEIVDKVSTVGLDAVQLHGSESVEFLEELIQRLPTVWVIKVVHLPPRGEQGIEDEDALQKLKGLLEVYAALCDAVLLDTSIKGGPSGGTGAAFDWQVVKKAQETWGIPVIVAGGLTDKNVGELVSMVAPFGVDVASGVEDAPGIKCAEKTSAYVRGAKRARSCT